MDPGAWLETASAGLLLIPLVRLTRIGYADWWWEPGEAEITPFSPSWSLRAPLWLWYLTFWIANGAALILAVARGNAAHLAAITAGVEAGYALLFLGKKSKPLDPSFPEAEVAFGLWHNAVLEELYFRGPLLLLGIVTGLSQWSFWPFLFIPVTALAFGLYHRRMQPKRFVDTTVFGAVLGAIALRYGLLAAILLHSIHNACALPLGHRDPLLRAWRLERYAYIAGLSMLALLRSGAAALLHLGVNAL